MGTAELPTAGFVGVCWGAVYAVRLILADAAGQLVHIKNQFAGSSSTISWGPAANSLVEYQCGIYAADRRY